ncbi:MAG: dihydrodipicolinate synthase family protein [Armatimonadetes bacterium]|nr:dihydrodipicolinate synthase family protein [Armatimonadota bacterium]
MINNQISPVSFCGVFPAVTTQMHQDQSIDWAAQAKHLEILIDSGIHGLILCGSLGENQTLLPEEKRAVVKHAKEVAAGRLPVLSGVAEMSTAASCQYVQDMEALGADGVMVLPAMVYKSDPRETMAHFRTVAAASKPPIIVYNNPVGYGVDITPKMFAELSDVETLVAIKESSADTTRITELYNACGDRYAIFGGVDTIIPECVLMGATGWIAGVGLAFPKENARMWELMMAGDWDKARELWRWFLPLMTLDIGPHFVQKIKLVLQEAGLGSEWVRAPRLTLAGTERDEILTLIHKGLSERPKL